MENDLATNKKLTSMMRRELTESADVTVIVLIYNDAILGRRAIQSVLSQTYQKLKVKILDNGSTDGTAAMIRSFADDPRIEIVTNPANQRSEFAAREALKTDTEFLSFLFSDDFYEPSRIEAMLLALKQSSAAAVFSNCLYKNENGGALNRFPIAQFKGDVAKLNRYQHLRHFLSQGNSLHPCAMLIRTKDYKEIGGFKGYLHRIGDMDFFARLLVQRHVHFIPDELQTITVWSSGRNESHTNHIDHRPILIERNRLLQIYRANELLDIVGKVFPEVANKITPESSRAVRLFWLGHSILGLHSMDYMLVGTSWMMEAFDASPTEIESVCQTHFKKTFAEYCYQISSSGMDLKKILVLKAKAHLKKMPVLDSFLRLMRDLVRS